MRLAADSTARKVRVSPSNTSAMASGCSTTLCSKRSWILSASGNVRSVSFQAKICSNSVSESRTSSLVSARSGTSPAAPTIQRCSCAIARRRASPTRPSTLEDPGTAEPRQSNMAIVCAIAVPR